MNRLMYMEQSFDNDPMGATNLARTYFLNQQQMNVGSMRPLRKTAKKKKKRKSRRKGRSKKRKKKRYDSSSSSSSSESSSEDSSSEESEDEKGLARSFKSMDISSNDSTIESSEGGRKKKKKGTPQLPTPVTTRSRGETRSRDNKTTDDYAHETESQNRNRIKGKQRRMTELAESRMLDELDKLGPESLAKRERDIDSVIRQVEEELLKIPSTVETTTTSTDGNDLPPLPPPLSNVVHPDSTTRTTRSSRSNSRTQYSEGSGSL